MPTVTVNLADLCEVLALWQRATAGLESELPLSPALQELLDAGHRLSLAAGMAELEGVPG